MKKVLVILLALAAALTAFIGVLTFLSRHGDCPFCRNLKAILGGNDYTVMPMDEEEV